ncbi:terminase small subunit [Tenacibaculum sp. 190524A05c]|uniref:terminase small subunit n=1 Tax=Tenacibaculum platacis TaxID=3137852 RepID=UPI0031FB63FD
MGKNKYIKTPEKMLELFNEYKKHVKDNPRKKVDFKGKDAEKVIYDLEVPLTMEGFENYVFEKGVINDLGDYFSNKNNKYSEYSTICSRIKNIIRQDQIEGGMVNIYNPSITQRLNGLVDKKETSLDITEFFVGNDED